jgi:diacylglycerol kinase (ATP)
MDTEQINPHIYKNSGMRRIFKAFFYSLEDMASTVKHEAAFRQELVLAAILVSASFFLHVPLAQHLLLVASVLLVLFVELLNSAIEAVVDDISLRNRPLVKRAKDMGRAVVLPSLLNCLICWASVMTINWDRLV